MMTQVQQQQQQHQQQHQQQNMVATHGLLPLLAA
jgi:hypothetical protein